MNYITLHTTHNSLKLYSLKHQIPDFIWIVTELLQSCGCEKLHGEHRFGKVFVLCYTFREKYALFFSPFLRSIIATLQRISGNVCLRFSF